MNTWKPTVGQRAWLSGGYPDFTGALSGRMVEVCRVAALYPAPDDVLICGIGPTHASHSRWVPGEWLYQSEEACFQASTGRIALRKAGGIEGEPSQEVAVFIEKLWDAGVRVPTAPAAAETNEQIRERLKPGTKVRLKAGVTWPNGDLLFRGGEYVVHDLYWTDPLPSDKWSPQLAVSFRHASFTTLPKFVEVIEEPTEPASVTEARYSRVGAIIADGVRRGQTWQVIAENALRTAERD